MQTLAEAAAPMTATTPVQPSTSKALASQADNQNRAAIAKMLMALASHYWRPDFSPSQAAQLVADFVEDLIEFPLAEIEIAILEYRRGAENEFFPKPGKLRKIIIGNRSHRAQLERLGDGAGKRDTRPCRWWGINRRLWKPHWRESDVPEGEMVRDQATGKWRQPERGT